MSENQQSQVPQLFQGGGAVEVSGDGAAVARAVQEVQAALVVAKRYPRDEVKAMEKILTACKRKSLAEVAEYEYSKGGTKIIGPSIDLIMAVANRWGNVLYGWDEVDRLSGQSRIRAWAWDIENNGRAERTFYVKHWQDTRAGGRELKDEREIYEAIANVASRRVRACLEQVIDQDVINAAVDQCHRTLREGERTPLRDRVVQMVVAFGEFGVTQAMIEKRLGNKSDAISENQLASLRRVYKSLKDGVGQREDYFKPDGADPNLAGADASRGQSETAPTPKTEGTPEGAPGVAAPAKTKKKEATPYTDETPLAKVRRLCRDADPKLPEGKLLEWLAKTGSTDGSPASLEELAMQFPKVIKLIAEDEGFANILKMMKGE